MTLPRWRAHGDLKQIRRSTEKCVQQSLNLKPPKRILLMACLCIAGQHRGRRHHVLLLRGVCLLPDPGRDQGEGRQGVDNISYIMDGHLLSQALNMVPSNKMHD